MLVKFIVKNYKSYKNQVVFSMEKAPKIEDLSYSIIKQKIGKHQYKILPTSVIYGPNAAGKSNINDAVKTLQAVILRGDIKNAEVAGKVYACNNLELIPFLFGENGVVDFYIEFIDGDYHYTYELKIDVGKPLNEKAQRRVVYEMLKINSQTIFERDGLVITNLDILRGHKEDFAEEMNLDMMQFFSDALVEDSLFVSNGFKLFSKRFSQQFINWFREKLIIISDFATATAVPKLSSERKLYINDFVNKVAKESGCTGKDIVYVKNESSTITTSLIETDPSGRGIFVPVDIIESYGTKRIIDLAPTILNAIRKGYTLLVDELDVALHPMVLMNFISLFHNDEININKAQLIFNTHNPIYLNNSIFRRDEIKFVEKDFETHESTMYMLSDFGTQGKSGVRNTTDYMKNYFMNKYGAIIDIDYTNIFKNELRKEVINAEKDN